MLKALRWAVRDLHALLPDDYDYPAFDVIAYCDDGTMRAERGID